MWKFFRICVFVDWVYKTGEICVLYSTNNGCGIVTHKRNISVFVSSLEGGGAERVMLNLATGFAARGHKVDLILARNTGKYFREVPDSFRLVFLKQHSRFSGLMTVLRRKPSLFFKLLTFHFARMLRLVPDLLKHLETSQTEIIFSGLHHCNIAALCACACIDERIGCVVVEHNTLSRILDSVPSRTKRLLPLITYFYPKADKIVTVSNGVADDLAKTAGIGRLDISSIYNPVVTPELYEQAKQDPQHPWFDKTNIPVVFGLGRLTPQKDFPTLLRAFARVREKCPARLFICGEGKRREELEDLASKLELNDDFLLPGFVENPFAYMSRASVFVLSSAWEGFGNVVAEALACGCPIVSTNCHHGPSEILEFGKFGRLVPVGDVNVMASAILETIKDPPNRDILIGRSRAFEIDTIIDRYEKLITEPI